MEDIEFSPEQHKTWAELYRRQEPKIRRYASAVYLEGFDKLELLSESIPTIDHLNSKIPAATGWTVIRTDVRFTEADDWYRFFDRK
ncbi:MAG: hypothetical protein V3V29_10240, partial [Acidimicrobiia bacterium]